MQKRTASIQKLDSEKRKEGREGKGGKGRGGKGRGGDGRGEKEDERRKGVQLMTCEAISCLL